MKVETMKLSSNPEDTDELVYVHLIRVGPEQWDLSIPGI